MDGDEAEHDDRQGRTAIAAFAIVFLLALALFSLAEAELEVLGTVRAGEAIRKDDGVNGALRMGVFAVAGAPTFAGFTRLVDALHLKAYIKFRIHIGIAVTVFAAMVLLSIETKF